jgi:hypothetical protein
METRISVPFSQERHLLRALNRIYPSYFCKIQDIITYILGAF